MSFEALGCLYRNAAEAAEALFATWIEADGQNSPATVRDWLNSHTDQELAAELVRDWSLPVEVEQGDIVEACARYRAAL